MPPPTLAGWGRRLVLALLYPATAGLPPRRWAAGRHQQEIAAACRQGRAQRVSFVGHTAGAHLDGLWLPPPSPAGEAVGAHEAAAAAAPAAAPPARPCLVVVVGNAMTYEMIFPQARTLADAFGLGLLLYNSRGIGRSLGAVTCPEDAVDDCCAALAWALGRGGPVGVYGISLGAAWAVGAAHKMATRGELPAGGLGLVALVRAFASPRQVVAAHLGAGAGRLVERALSAADFGPLDLAAALRRPLPAQQVMLTAARRDRLIPPAAQLAGALGMAANKVVQLPSGQPALVVAEHGAHHFDRDLRAPLHDALLRRFAAAGGIS